MAEFKQFLGSFCAGNGLEVVYTEEKEEEGFYCEVSQVIAKLMRLLHAMHASTWPVNRLGSVDTNS